MGLQDRHPIAGVCDQTDDGIRGAEQVDGGIPARSRLLWSVSAKV